MADMRDGEMDVGVTALQRFFPDEHEQSGVLEAKGRDSQYICHSRALINILKVHYVIF